MEPHVMCFIHRGIEWQGLAFQSSDHVVPLDAAAKLRRLHDCRGLPCLTDISSLFRGIPRRWNLLREFFSLGHGAHARYTQQMLSQKCSQSVHLCRAPTFLVRPQVYSVPSRATSKVGESQRLVKCSRAPKRVRDSYSLQQASATSSSRGGLSSRKRWDGQVEPLAMTLRCVVQSHWRRTNDHCVPVNRLLGSFVLLRCPLTFCSNLSCRHSPLGKDVCRR